MTGRVKFPSYLYIRVDRPLRAALAQAADARGTTVSDIARRELRKVFPADDRAGNPNRDASA